MSYPVDDGPHNDAWKELDADDDVRVIVNTGKGRAFQTGVDVKEVSEAGGMAGRGAGRLFLVLGLGLRLGGLAADL